MNNAEHSLIYIQYEGELGKKQHISIDLVDGAWVTTGDAPVDDAARQLFNRIADFANAVKTPLEHMMIAYEALDGNPEFAPGNWPAHSVLHHLGAALKAYERHVDAQQAELDKIQHMPEDMPE